MAQIPSYLFKSRHGIFYFRVRIPTLIRSVFAENRREHRVSLKTSNLRHAARLASLLSTRYYDFFSYVGSAVNDKDMSDAEMAEFVKKHFPNGLPMTVMTATRILANGETLIVTADGRIPEEAKWFRETYESGFANNSDINSVSTIVPQKGNSAAPTMTFGMVIDAYEKAMSIPDPITHKLPEGFSTTGDRKERIAKLRIWPLLIGDIPLSLVKPELVEAALEKLRLMPPNFSKKIDNFPLVIDETVETQKAKVDQWHRYVSKLSKTERLAARMDSVVSLISPKTVNNYSSVLKMFFEWAQQKNYVTEQPAGGLYQKVQKNIKTRTRYQPEDLQMIFESSFFKDHNYREAPQYWVPHIQLFTGTRSNEICQLEVSDVINENDIWCFRLIPDEFGTQRVKNNASKRIVPIHSELIRLGFLDYVDAMKKYSENQQLFPSLYLNENRKKYNILYGKWYNDFLATLGVKRKGIDTHSFRHTAITCLRNAKVLESLVSEVVGHDPSDDDETDGRRKKKSITFEVYADEHPMVERKETVELLKFDLSLTGFTMSQKRLQLTSTVAYANSKKRPSKSVADPFALPENVSSNWDFE